MRLCSEGFPTSSLSAQISHSLWVPAGIGEWVLTRTGAGEDVQPDAGYVIRACRIAGTGTERTRSGKRESHLANQDILLRENTFPSGCVAF